MLVESIAAGKGEGKVGVALRRRRGAVMNIRLDGSGKWRHHRCSLISIIPRKCCIRQPYPWRILAITLPSRIIFTSIYRARFRDNEAKVVTGKPRDHRRNHGAHCEQQE